MTKTLSITISQIFSVLLNFCVQLILARFYGKHGAGTYLSIMSLMNILSVLGLFGINNYYIFLKSKNGYISKLVASSIIQIYFLMNITSVFLIIILGMINFYEYLFLIISSIFMMILTNYIAIISSYIQVKEKIVKVSLIQMTIPFLKIIGLFGGALIMQPLFKGYSFIILIISSIMIALFSIKYFKIIFKYNILKFDNFYSTFKSLIPYAILNITFLLYTQANTFYVGIWMDSKNAAYFGLAYLFLNTIFVLPTAIYQRLLAHKLIYLLYNSIEEFKKLMSNLQDLLIILSSIMILLLYVSAKYLITILFGENYFKSIEILQLLTFIIPFRLLSISIGTVLSNDDYIKERIKVELFVTFFNFLLNLILIKNIGVTGAILSSIITEMILSFSFANVMRKKLKIKVKVKLYLPLIIVIFIFITNLPHYIEYLIILLMCIILVKPILSRLNVIKNYL